ncbi:hypothetical protein CFP59_08484 [Streptomyces malaysiensis subsp. malaysiensis]|nr:hypothetical protein CFP59_08484 [Streptomyces sp. M56]SCF85987.1 hypothetical protein GA0115260_103342 [Streptomyces sp. MnatMP-M27]
MTAILLDSSCGEVMQVGVNSEASDGVLDAWNGQSQVLRPV